MVNLRSIDVGYCTELDCSRALELLASWDWATQLESLRIAGTNAEGSFEVLAGLVNLRSINVFYCEKLDCSRALELLASWDWAMQLESLNIGKTNAEGQLKYCWSRPAEVQLQY